MKKTSNRSGFTTLKNNLYADMIQEEGQEDFVEIMVERIEDFVEENVDSGEHDELIGSGVQESSILQIYKHDDDLVEKVLPEFDILKEIVRYEENLKLDKYMEDGNVLLHPDLSTTKIQFSRGLLEYFEQTQTFEKNRTLLVNFLANTIGGLINLPTSKRIIHASNTTEDDRDENIQHDDNPVSDFNVKNLFDATVRCDLELYCSKQSRFFSFDQCLNDCTLYLGKHQHSMRCGTCKQSRFRPCTQRGCRTHGTSHCPHLLQDGSPYKQLHYRPIIILIYDLLSHSNFHKYLNYDRRAHHNSTEYSDFMDGKLARGHLKEMEDNFNAWVEQDKEVRGNAIMINLLFSEFYDSGQLFKSYVFDFWPLCFGILNLPPNLRGKVGLSYFLTAVYGGKHTEVEKVLFNDLVCDELRCLYDGIEHDVNGVKYFIQARMVMHILDTKAAEPCMGYQSNSNSHFGCSNCGGVTGIYNGRQCIFLGNRNYLPQLHVLRFFGQTGRCCPKTFYDHLAKDQWFYRERFHHLDNNGVYETFCAEKWQVVSNVIENTKKQVKVSRGGQSKEEIVTSLLSIKKTQDDIDQNFTPCDGNVETKQQILKFFFVDESQYEWFHTGEFGFENTFDLFRPYLYYRHQDYRTRKPYRRVPYMEYFEYARRAEEINSRRRAKKKSHIHGIQGLWYWARLPYADLETQFTWPFVHAISGVVVKVLRLIINDLYKQDKKSGKALDASSSKLKIKRVKVRSGKDKRRRQQRKNKNEVHSDDGTGDLNDDENQSDADEDQYEDVDEDDDDDQNDENDKDDNQPCIDKSWIPDHQPPYKKRQAPYQARNKAVTDRVQSWLDCVILPPNVSDDWNVSLVSPSSMKIAQKLKMVLCYWDFVMESINIHKAYQKLFRMLGHDMSMMLAASIDKSKVDYILYCVIETIATWEGMMPGVANSFQLHELVDLPVSIAMYGPPVFVSELPGERMMNLLKNWKLKANIGGNLSFLKSIMRKEVDHELAKMRQYSIFPDRNDSNLTFNSSSKKLIYNGVPFAITHAERKGFTNTLLNEYELEFLCDTLYFEVVRRYKEPADRDLSAIYRIFTCAEIPANKTWVQKLRYMTDNADSMKFSDEDVKFAYALLRFKPVFYKEALIYGTHFYSRGSQCRELAYSSNYYRRYGGDTFSPSNTNTGQWFDKHNTRSWCKFQIGQSTTRYGLLNAFFDVKSLGDQSLNGLLLASMTTFKFTTTSGKVERVSREESFDNQSIHFVALQDIFPTQVCTIPFLDENTAISIKNTMIEDKMRKYVVSIHADKNLNIKPQFYVMILMHPDRLALQPGVDERPFTKFM